MPSQQQHQPLTAHINMDWDPRIDPILQQYSKPRDESLRLSPTATLTSLTEPRTPGSSATPPPVVGLRPAPVAPKFSVAPSGPQGPAFPPFAPESYQFPPPELEYYPTPLEFVPEFVPHVVPSGSQGGPLPPTQSQWAHEQRFESFIHWAMPVEETPAPAQGLDSGPAPSVEPARSHQRRTMDSVTALHGIDVVDTGDFKRGYCRGCGESFRIKSMSEVNHHTQKSTHVRRHPNLCERRKCRYCPWTSTCARPEPMRVHENGCGFNPKNAGLISLRLHKKSLHTDGGAVKAKKTTREFVEEVRLTKQATQPQGPVRRSSRLAAREG